jgi:surface antigen
VVGARAMKRRSTLLLVFAAAVVAGPPTLAQSHSIPGLIAERATAALTYEDRLAAYDAEQAVLATGGLVLGHNWKGPNGAYGTIIVGSFLPTVSGFSECRRFIHVIHHKDDGGTNPTFHGTICRDGGGQWRKVANSMVSR